MEVSRDPTGSDRVPLSVMRTAPGGRDWGQFDRTVSGKVALGASPVTVQLGAVTAGRTRYISDLSFGLASSSCEVSLQADGVTVWQLSLGTAGLIVPLRWLLSFAAGQSLTLVFGAAAAGTPLAYFNVHAWEQ